MANISDRGSRIAEPSVKNKYYPSAGGDSRAKTKVMAERIMRRILATKRGIISIFYKINHKVKEMIGVPIHLLHEAENHVVTVELKTGEMYRGYLIEAEVRYS